MQHASKKGSAAAAVRPAIAVARRRAGRGGGPGARVRDRDRQSGLVECAGTTRSATTSAGRVESRDQAIGNSIIADEGTYSFDKGDIVQNRLDLLTEFDVVYKRMFGFRVSAAGWYDNAYDGHRPRGNPALVVPNLPASGPFPPLRQALPNGGQFTSYDNNEYSPYTERFYAGPSGEILDAFVFANFDAGPVPMGVKVGPPHACTGANRCCSAAICTASRIRRCRSTCRRASPRPAPRRRSCSARWRTCRCRRSSRRTCRSPRSTSGSGSPLRFPEGGTLSGPVDFLFNGPDRQLVPMPGLPDAGGSGACVHQSRARLGRRAEAARRLGLSARWSPEWLDGTMGFYYRNFTDKLPQVLITSLTPSPPLYFNNATPVGRVVALNGQYRLVYADDIDLLGISLSKNIAGVSVGAEVSYRRNMPLLSQTLGNVAGMPISAGEHARRARRHLARAGQRVRHDFQDAAVRHRRLPGRAHLVALGQGAERAEPVPGSKGSELREPEPEQVGRLRDQGFLGPRDQLHADLVPGVPGRGPARCRSPSRRASRATRPLSFGGNEDARQLLDRAGRSTTASSTASTSSTSTSLATTKSPRTRCSAASRP